MRYWALAALPVLAWPGVAAAKFAPVEGTTYRYEIVEMREAGMFTAERRVVFRRAAQGWTAELTVTSSRAAAEHGVESMAGRMLAALVGKTIRYTLDDQGAVTSVEDQDALIKLVVDAIGSATSTTSTGARDAMASRMAQTLAALGPDMQRRLLASLLTSMIGGTLSDAQTGQRAITLPAGSAMGASAAVLSGTERVARTADRIIIDTAAEGPAPTANATIRIEQHREIDTATGIVLINNRRTETWLTATPDKRQVATSSAKVAF